MRGLRVRVFVHLAMNGEQHTALTVAPAAVLLSLTCLGSPALVAIGCRSSAMPLTTSASRPTPPTLPGSESRPISANQRVANAVSGQSHEYLSLHRRHPRCVLRVLATTSHGVSSQASGVHGRNANGSSRLSRTVPSPQGRARGYYSIRQPASARLERLPRPSRYQAVVRGGRDSYAVEGPDQCRYLNPACIPLSAIPLVCTGTF